MSLKAELALWCLACGFIVAIVAGTIMWLLMALDYMFHDDPNSTFRTALHANFTRLKSPAKWSPTNFRPDGDQ